jgi:hypothetical protein
MICVHLVWLVVLIGGAVNPVRRRR